MFTEYENCKKEWVIIQLEKTQCNIKIKSTLCRRRGKNSKYFLNLEKRNYENKHMKSVINSESILIKYIEKFYATNKCKEERQTLTTEFLEKIDIPKLNEEQKELLDCDLQCYRVDCGFKKCKMTSARIRWFHLKFL